MALSLPATAQEPRRPGCEQAEYRQFDFWLGDWDVLTPDGSKAGANRIERILNGCALLENWTSARGGAGKSLNFYNPAGKRWEQAWVADSGWIVKYQGEYRDGAMRFEGESIQRDGSSVRSRMTVTPLEDGRVRQLIEQSKDGGATWSTGFDATYVRRAASSP
ncbi:MAG TPA: hypothetical protein VGA39_02605 [Candidatus Acidoferrales bacterium]